MTTPQEPINFTVEQNTIRFQGSLRSGGGGKRLLQDLTRTIELIQDSQIEIDFSEVTGIDSLGACLLAELVVHSRVQGKEITFINSSEEIDRGLDRYYFPSPEVKLPEISPQPIISLGEKAYLLWEAAGELLLLVSETVYWSFVGLFNPSGHRKGAVSAQALGIGVGALPVVALISLLIGIVLALQSSEQLRQFGANIYVADLVVVAMTREMGPLMTAILLAGRSGAAIAAEISTMTVSEEIDALRTMGINPVRYVIVPKILGITLTAPLLTILATIIGIFGGFIISLSALDLTPQSFYHEALTVLFPWDIATGMIKSLVFSWLIVILSSHFGLRVAGGAEGVGKATTKAVVASIFAVILADSLLGLLFYL